MKSFKVNSVFLLICMVFTLTSCMTPDPVNSQGENVLKEKISQESKIPMIISSFTKTNGIKREVMGQPIYTMEFSTQIKIGQKSGFIGDNAFLKDITPIDKFGGYYSIYWADLKKTILFEGALLSYDGEITFEKTEKGWRSKDCKLGHFNIVSNPNPLDIIIGSWIIEDSGFNGAIAILKKDDKNGNTYFEITDNMVDVIDNYTIKYTSYNELNDGIKFKYHPYYFYHGLQEDPEENEVFLQIVNQGKITWKEKGQIRNYKRKS